MTDYRIVATTPQGAGRLALPVYRIQQRGWFWWNDVRVTDVKNYVSGVPGTIVLRLNTLQEAQDWIDLQLPKGHLIQRVVETYTNV